MRRCRNRYARSSPMCALAATRPCSTTRANLIASRRARWPSSRCQGKSCSRRWSRCHASRPARCARRASAYGTRSVPRVDKIVGPGNVYVAEAKRQVFGQVGIDMVAGPSEILVIADGRTPADWLAMDLFSQAEHDEAAQALLLSPQASYLDQVELSMKKLLPAMPRREIIAASLQARGALIETRDLEEACALANRVAPEHLELSVEDPQAWLPKLKHAGAIFLGRWSREALGG